MQLYDQETSQQILNTHLPKMASHATPDKIIWPPSTNGEYQVKKAYDILHQTVSPTNNLNDSQAMFWENLWKLPIPNKILTFTWKLLHQALPVKIEIARRGINCDTLC